MALDETLDDCGQGVARLRGCRGDRQRPGVFLAEFLSDRAEVFGVLQHPLGDFNDDAPRLGEIDDPFPVPDQDLDAELVFEQANLFADAGLRGTAPRLLRTR